MGAQIILHMMICQIRYDLDVILHQCEEPIILLSALYQLTVGMTTSNTPVPVRFNLPITMFPEGVVKSSKSPFSAASDKKAAVVSYEAFSNGDGFVEIPRRLKGLYPPSKVYTTFKRRVIA